MTLHHCINDGRRQRRKATGWREEEEEREAKGRGRRSEERRGEIKGIILTSADFLAHQLPQHVSAAPSNTLCVFHQASLSTGCVRLSYQCVHVS